MPKARIFSINPINPQRRLCRHIAEILNDGGVAIIPTDTVYVLGASVHHPNAIKRIRQLKSIDHKKYMSFIMKEISWFSEYARNISNSHFKIMKKLIPGPYTMILNAAKIVPKIALNKQKTVGIRVPDNPITLLIVEELGHPIVSTSLQLEDDYLSDPEDIIEYYRNKVDAIADGGIIKIEPSTVIDFTQEPIKVLRKGKGDISFLE